ncbi:hypothetical protein [Streptomyces luteolus]|uniref:Uncharacterized protein n=1 Tax=Streptomyces luteolus TaxID=3043615 RepID=A0ABT6SR38_9ACTN|nr:hypothetical protein [Streptomyces sp. B-S-A12]MDI3418063.1 hypothetical protein [Streptomyces sp. B-S-A12]
MDTTDVDEMADRLVAMAKTVLADRSTDEQHFFAQMMLRQTAQLIEAEAEYAGLCFVEHEGEQAMATLLVNRVPSLGRKVDEAAEATKAQLKELYPNDEVRISALAVDHTPAVTRIGGLEVTVPPEISPDGQPQTLRQGIIQTYVPLPGQGETMVFELNTPSPEAWDMYADMFDAIVGTLDWATAEERAEQRELQQNAAIPAQPGPQAPAPQEQVPQPQQPEPEPVAQGVAEAVHRISRLVLDAVGMRGPVDEAADHLAAAPCPPCRAKGLTSGCTARHHWEMTGLTPATLQDMFAAASSHLNGSSWSQEFMTEGQATFKAQGDSISAQGYTVSLTSDTGQRRLLLDVATACTRGTATAVVDDFG